MKFCNHIGKLQFLVTIEIVNRELFAVSMLFFISMAFLRPRSVVNF